MPELTVVAVGLDPGGLQPVLLLREVGGQGRTLPVLIGLPEAGALEIQRSGIAQPRPPTHALICDVIDALGHRVDHVRVTGLREGIFHAELVFARGVRVSSRLTDAVILAVRLGVPIHAEESVLAAGHAPVEVLGLDDPVPDDPVPDDPVPDDPNEEAPGPIEPEELDRFRRFLDDASPEDFEQD